MRNISTCSGWLGVLLFGVVCIGGAQAPSQNAAGDLGGTSWQLVKFQGSDDKALTPDDQSKYTIAFESDSGVSVRIDCNRGHGMWKSSGPNQLEFGPLALTRAMCGPAALNERIAKDWSYVRSYTLKDSHLFLSLMADGGIYEFEPTAKRDRAGGLVKGTAAYRERMALPPDAVFEATVEDVSKADAQAQVIGSVCIERLGNPPFHFEVAYDPAKIDRNHSYSVRARITEGNRLIFTTTQSYPVLTRGNRDTVALQLQRTSGSAGTTCPTLGPAISGLPATFFGTLPCADCPGIRYQVDLFPDHRFVSRMTYQERNTRFDERGQWQLAADGKTLVLQGGRGAKEQFALHDADTLRKLDAEGHEIESQLNYDLKRAPTFEPLESQAQDVTNVSLENTYWTLTSLGTERVPVVSEQREPHFILNSENRRVTGSGGCNRLIGSYELNGDQLKFSQMAGTMMACAQGMDTEKAFLQALGQVNAWKTMGTQLELFDTEGKLVARFEVRHMN